MTKGKRRERQAADLFEEAGYETFRPQESKWGETDMFGLYDLLAIGPNLWLVQVKSNRAEGVRDWMLKAQEHQFTSRDIRVGFLICYDNQGWRLLRPAWEQRYRTDVDERESSCQMGDRIIEYLSDGE